MRVNKYICTPIIYSKNYFWPEPTYRPSLKPTVRHRLSLVICLPLNLLESPPVDLSDFRLLNPLRSHLVSQIVNLVFYRLLNRIFRQPMNLVDSHYVYPVRVHLSSL